MNNTVFESKGEQILEEIGMSKAEFARRMGIQRQNVKALFRSKDLRVIRKAAEVMGVQFEMLVGYTEPFEYKDYSSFSTIPLDIDLLSSTPVCSLSGHEFEPVEGVTFINQVASFFESQGGVAISSMGEVLLDRKGIKNSFYHGMSAIKRTAFAAVKDVLEHGSVILPLGNHSHNKKEQTGMIAAPVLIAGERYVCVVVVIFNQKVRRLYVHEAFITKKLLAVVATSLPSEDKSSLAQPQGDVAKVLIDFLVSKYSNDIS